MSKAIRLYAIWVTDAVYYMKNCILSTYGILW